MRVATPFNVSSAAIAAGVAALSDVEHLEKSVELARVGCEYLMEHIPFEVYDSQANFVMVDVAPLRAKDVCDGLFEKGIIVRDCSSFRDAGESLVRVTVGTRGQNEMVVEGFSVV